MQELLTPSPKVTHDIFVNLPMMSGFYDLTMVAQGLDYKRTDLVSLIEVQAVLDDSEKLQATIEEIREPFTGRGAYVHGPFSVKLDKDTGVFKVNALKQAPGITLRVAVKLWR